MELYDIVVIGAGPSGMVAAISACEKGAKTLLIDKENKSGGLLNQCINENFQIHILNEKLFPVEFMNKFEKMLNNKNLQCSYSTFVLNIERINGYYISTITNERNLNYKIKSKIVILATGIREKSSKEMFISNQNPAGIMTAITAQYFLNVKGYIPFKNPVLLGGGNIGIAVIKKLISEGATVKGIYNNKDFKLIINNELEGYLKKHNIKYNYNKVITKILGQYRVTAVEVCEIDEDFNPILKTAEIIKCDGVILSGGLVPNNTLANKLNIPICDSTKSVYVDQSFMTLQDNFYCCGSSLNGNNLMNYFCESGFVSGNYALQDFNNKRKLIRIREGEGVSYCFPQFFNKNSKNKLLTLYFTSEEVFKRGILNVSYGEKIIYKRKFVTLNPHNVETVYIDFSNLQFKNHRDIYVYIENTDI